MFRLLLFCTVLFVSAACGRDSDIAPTLASEVTGTYQTNGFLDYLSLALPGNQMPAVTLNQETENSVTLTYQQQYPEQRTLVLSGIRVQRLVDGIQLVSNGSVIGTLRTDRAFTNKGMEYQASVLRLKWLAGADSLSFTGAK